MDPNRETAKSPGSTDAAARFALWLVLCRASILAALAASAALYLQYLRPAEAAFCGLESGCEAVRRAGFSYFFGSPLFSIPLVGLVAYAVVLWVSLFAAKTPWILWLTVAGAVGALGLLGAQAFVVHAFCWLCVVVDVSAVLAAAFALAQRRQVGNAVDPLKRGAWILLGGVAIAFPVLWTVVKPAPPVPESVRAVYVPGKINVVEFADFECPYCRKLHPVLKSALHDYPAERIHFVRRHVPLPGHPDALPAARAAVCAEEQGLGEKLADKLVELDLSPSADRRAAIEVGVDAARFDACLASTEPDRRIAADTRALEEAGMAGLPTTYVQNKRLLGAVPETTVRDALDHAMQGGGNSGIPGQIYVPLGLALLFAVAWLGRSAHGKLPHERTS
jgi:predicted DsbA family dithiol-disulfide isomerase/uncharacterized membrane protein